MSEPQASAPGRGLTLLRGAADETSLWLFFALVGGAGASVLALGMLLRSGQQLTQRVVAGTVLHSLAWGVAVFLMLYEQQSMGLPFTLGISVASGIGTASFIDLVLLFVKQRLGVSVVINPPAPPASKE